jgi:RpiR family carbohydrate utilization transcriptional regulator
MTESAADAEAPHGTLLETIAGRLGQLRQSEKKVADVILANPIAAMEFNMAGLADEAGVSEPTVMRFCAAIGFDGFRSFKIALAQAIALGLPVTHSAIGRDDTTADVAEKVFNHTISSLDRARRHLDVVAVERAIELLTHAGRLLFIGFGASGIIAQDAQQKFPIFGVPCDAPVDYHQQFIAASMSSPDTVVVAISHTARTHETLRVAEAARDVGASVVAITGDEGPLSYIADVEVRLSTFEDTDFYTPTVSRLAGLVVIDILATGVSLRKPSRDLARIGIMKESLARMRSES